MANDDLSHSIQHLVMTLPSATIDKLIDLLDNITDVMDWSNLRIRLYSIFPQPEVRILLDELITNWQTYMPNLSAQAIAFAFQSATKVEEYHRKREQLELVWTGPIIHEINLRRTDEALLEVIESATKTLYIVSFAVYKARHIRDALHEAIERGVTVHICLETPESSNSKINYSTHKALGEQLIRKAHVYVWPLHKRTKDMAGNHGSLHAKIAVADSSTMLLSSANLTDYAMNLNIEMGLMVVGGETPKTVVKQLERLIEQQIFETII
jgi:phosphatidylserine/phosphatidylglycerophosphate/cardiolipin synthase-like enzyme